jgi:hypothetical protein
MHVAIVVGALHGLLQDEELAVGRHRPVVVGQSVSQNGLGTRGDVGLDELSAVDARARGEQRVLTGHPALWLRIGARDGALPQVIDIVVPCGLLRSGGLVRGNEGITAIAAQRGAAEMLAVEEVLERQLPSAAVAKCEDRVAVAAHADQQRVVVVGLRQVFDDHLMGGRLEGELSAAFLSVDIELVVLELLHVHRGLGVTAVSDGELQQVQCVAVLALRSQGAGVGLTLARIEQADGSVE